MLGPIFSYLFVGGFGEGGTGCYCRKQTKVSEKFILGVIFNLNVKANEQTKRFHLSKNSTSVRGLKLQVTYSMLEFWL